MKSKIIHTSEIHVLSHLLSADDIGVIVYDPSSTLCSDDEHKFPVATRLGDVRGMANEMAKEKLCIINNSKEFLDIATADYIIEFNSDKTYEKRK